MRNIPRASLCITVLDDEDYRILMAAPCGVEAFGIFVALLIVGRERLQRGRARRLPESESLIFDDSTNHILAMAHVSRVKFTRCLRTLSGVVSDSGGKPWIYQDDDMKLVIRSFFKFNAREGWGGHRPGAGRPGKSNQVDFRENQDRPHGNSSWFLSHSDSNSNTPPLPPRGGKGEMEVEMREEEPFHPLNGAAHIEVPAKPALAMPGKPSAETLATFVGLARAALGERCDLEDFQTHIAGWLFAHPDEWVRDAIGCTAARAATISRGHLASYTASCLSRWHPNGPPRNEHDEARKKLGQVQIPSGPHVPREISYEPPDSVWRQQAPRKGERP